MKDEIKRMKEALSSYRERATEVQCRLRKLVENKKSSRPQAKRDYDRKRRIKFHGISKTMTSIDRIRKDLLENYGFTEETLAPASDMPVREPTPDGLKGNELRQYNRRTLSAYRKNMLKWSSDEWRRLSHIHFKVLFESDDDDSPRVDLGVISPRVEESGDGDEGSEGSGGSEDSEFWASLEEIF